MNILVTSLQLHVSSSWAAVVFVTRSIATAVALAKRYTVGSYSEFLNIPEIWDFIKVLL